MASRAERIEAAARELFDFALDTKTEIPMDVAYTEVPIHLIEALRDAIGAAPQSPPGVAEAGAWVRPQRDFDKWAEACVNGPETVRAIQGAYGQGMVDAQSAQSVFHPTPAPLGAPERAVELCPAHKVPVGTCWTHQRTNRHAARDTALTADQQAVAEELAHLGKCAVALDAACGRADPWAKPERDTFKAALAAFGNLMVECAGRKRLARKDGDA